MVDKNVPQKNAPVATIDETGYHKISTGFHPYFSPSVGASFKGTLVNVDDRQADFLRFEFISEHDVLCYTGPSDDQEEVLVKAGDPFNVSAYEQVRFEEYAGMSIIVKFKEKVKTSTPGRSVWKLELLVNEADYKLLMERRRIEMTAKVARARELRAQIEKARLNA